jgi:hypothetical protein
LYSDEEPESFSNNVGVQDKLYADCFEAILDYPWESYKVNKEFDIYRGVNL